MVLTAHRKAPNRAREQRERVWEIVEQQLGGRTICGRCHCTLVTFADKCTADLDQRCPGFEAIENVRRTAEEKVGLR